MAMSFLRIHPSVRAALANKKPIVALESTIITHGLPSPDNLKTALEIEQIVRDQGAIPATTAFLDGKAYIGLDQNQIERLAETGKKATKTSRRDVAGILAAGKGSIGATTVSGTMLLAHLAGIPIFGTGGIGGVHRGGERSLDISADLTELSRTPVAVFCSGCKSILDIPRTLEYLETMGVNVHSFSNSGEFPAFYTAKSGSKVSIVHDITHAAKIIHAGRSFGMQNGFVFGVPIPREYEQAGILIQTAVEQAVRESVEQGIDKRGKEATPWLLQRVGELTKGDSIVSNRGLVLNNVKVASQVANQLQKLKNESQEKVMEESLQRSSPALINYQTNR